MANPSFTIVPPGTSLGLTAGEAKAPGALASAPIGDFRKGRGASGCYEITWAITADKEWAFELGEDGAWKIGHVPTRTVVKSGPRTLRAARVYVGSGKARADLERIQARERGEHEAATDGTAERRAS